MYGGFFVNKYTKLFIGTMCFLAQATAFAGGSLKGEALQPVTIPNFDGGPIVSVGALYMVPSSTNTDYLGVKTEYDIAAVDPDPATTKRNWDHYRVDPDYDWGFTVGVGYMMAGNSKDVRLDWTHFNTDTSDSQTIYGALDSEGSEISKTAIFLPFGSHSLGVGVILGGEEIPDELYAKGKMKYRFDAVDFTLGQYVNVGKCLQVRKFAGLRYARLDSDLSSHYDLNSAALITGGPQVYSKYTWDGALDSSFNGMGPLAGLSASYGLGYGFGVNAMFDVALLVGQLKLNGSLDYDEYAQDANDAWYVTSQSDYTMRWDGRTVVAPAFDGSFSLDYGYEMGSGMGVMLEVGYKVSKYLNVVEQLDRTGSASSSSSVVDYARFDTDVTNFGLNGLFINLTLKA